MKKKLTHRLLPLLLTLVLAMAPAAQALTVEQTRDLLTEFYVDDVSPQVLEQTTVEKILSTLGDPYTLYFTPEEYQAFLNSMEDEVIGGIGIIYTPNSDGTLTITGTQPDSPAAGTLQEGDVITAVNGTSLAGMDSQASRALLQGELDTSLSLTYLRDGVSHTSSLRRISIVIANTTTDLLNGHVGYISCSAFGTDTAAHFQEGLTKYSQEADRWMVDLRGNGGGLVTAGVDAASLFTGPDVSSYLQGSDGLYADVTTNSAAQTQIPIIVLTDGQTASSAELFSAAIRDTNVGILVGGRTYGKGVTQSMFDQSSFPSYFPQGDALKLTTHRYFSPNGAATNTVGVIPHLLLSPENTPPAAVLLSSSAPILDNSRTLRLDMGSYWYISLDAALTEPFKLAFTHILEAIPSSASLMQGTGTGDEWRPVTPASVAAANGLDYKSRGFSDSASSPYGKQIDLLSTYGIVSGFGDGTFLPNNNLTRAELCSMLAQALWCNKPTGDSLFSDVPMDEWYGPAVNALAKMGIVSGVGGGLFQPNAPVDHQQLITIMGRLAQQLNMTFYMSADETPANLSAFSPYATWAQPAVWLLSSSQKGYFGNAMNLLWAEPSAIAPSAPSTRGEAATLVYQLLSQCSILPA